MRISSVSHVSLPLLSLQLSIRSCFDPKRTTMLFSPFPVYVLSPRHPPVRSLEEIVAFLFSRPFSLNNVFPPPLLSPGRSLPSLPVGFFCNFCAFEPRQVILPPPAATLFLAPPSAGEPFPLRNTFHPLVT